METVGKKLGAIVVAFGSADAARKEDEMELAEVFVRRADQ